MPSIHLPRPHQAQAEILAEARRFNVVACGRRFGKSTLGINRLIDGALRGQPVGWFSPTYKMLAEVWRDVARALQPVVLRRSVQQHRLELITGGVVDMWSLETPDVARGRKYGRVVVDEAAMIRHLDEAWQAILRPTLADLQGDLWALSTPKGRNMFWQMWSWGQEGGQPEWRSWRMATTSNPHIAASEIDAMRRDMPERTFSQEVLAQFLEDAGGVFRNVLAAATAEAQNGPVAGHQYVVGVDWAKSADFTVFALVDATASELVSLERFNQIDYEVQVGRLRALVERFKPMALVVERNSIGEPLIERLSRLGMPVQPFVTTNATKTAIVDALALALERHELAILNDAQLVAELQAYEMERLPSGLWRYGAPAGMHDDCVMALALAWYGAERGTVEVRENPFYMS